MVKKIHRHPLEVSRPDRSSRRGGCRTTSGITLLRIISIELLYRYDGGGPPPPPPGDEGGVTVDDGDDDDDDDSEDIGIWAREQRAQVG